MYYDGLRFRSETGKEVGAAALPSPKVGVLPGSDWYDTLSLIGGCASICGRQFAFR